MWPCQGSCRREHPKGSSKEQPLTSSVPELSPQSTKPAGNNPAHGRSTSPDSAHLSLPRRVRNCNRLEWELGRSGGTEVGCPSQLGEEEPLQRWPKCEVGIDRLDWMFYQDDRVCLRVALSIPVSGRAGRGPAELAAREEALLGNEASREQSQTKALSGSCHRYQCSGGEKHSPGGLVTQQLMEGQRAARFP